MHRERRHSSNDAPKDKGNGTGQEQPYHKGDLAQGKGEGVASRVQMHHEDVGRGEGDRHSPPWDTEGTGDRSLGMH